MREVCVGSKTWMLGDDEIYDDSAVSAYVRMMMTPFRVFWELFLMSKLTKLCFLCAVIRKWLTWRSQCDAARLLTAREFLNIPNRTLTFLRLHRSAGFWESPSQILRIKLMMRNCQSHKTMKTHRLTTTTTITWTVELLRHRNYHNHQKTMSAEHRRAL